MAEELQGLLEKIQKEGIDKANGDAEKIVAAAREKAGEIVGEARTKAEAMLKKAETDERVYIDRGRKALEQAARDVILSIGESLTTAAKALVRRSIAHVMTTDALQSILTEVIEHYARHCTSRVEVLVNPKQEKALTEYFMAEFGESLGKNVLIKGEGAITSGFRISVTGENVYHDFTSEAIADSLSQLLRPELGAITKNAAVPKQ